MFLRLYLFTVSIVVGWVWIATSPYLFTRWARHIFKKRDVAIISTFSTALFILQIAGISILPFPDIFNFLITATGVVAISVGGLLGIWAKLTMKKSWGLPAQHDIKRQNKLVTSGPFAYTRNPIYLSIILMVVGFELAMKSFLVVAVFIYLYRFQKAVVKEEQLLRKHFGREYEAYMKRTSRWFLV